MRLCIGAGPFSRCPGKFSTTNLKAQSDSAGCFAKIHNKKISSSINPRNGVPTDVYGPDEADGEGCLDRREDIKPNAGTCGPLIDSKGVMMWCRPNAGFAATAQRPIPALGTFFKRDGLSKTI